MLKLDLKDRKLLYELDHDSRQSNKQIAKKIGLSEQVTGNRIKRLQELGVIEYFYVKTNPAKLGYIHFKIYLRLHNLTKSKEAELIASLNGKNNLLWICSLRGKYDLVVSIYVKTVAEFTQKYDELFGSWKDYILDRNVILLEKARTYTRAHLLSKKESSEIKYGERNEEVKDLDAVDLKVLQILNQQGRLPLIDIAKKVKVSADTINYHIKKLQQSGIITGFGLKIDYSKINYSYTILPLKMQNMTADKYEKMNTFCRMNSNIVIQIKTIGNHDFELEIEYASKEELDLLMKSLRDNFVNEIKDYEILEVTREHSITYFPF